MKITSITDLLTHKHILLLQGKMGSFFNRFASFLHAFDIEVSKIHFNSGDKFFYHHKQAYDYTGKVADFSEWLNKFIKEKNIDAVVCFGDCRPHHLQARMLCKQLNISFFVFEEGYLRPDYITLEEHGINGFSQLDVNKIHQFPKAVERPLATHNRFYKLCISAIVYYIIVYLNQKKFPYYQHPRGMTAWQEARHWLKAPFRKACYYFTDKIHLPKHLLTQVDKQYFLVCLQVHNDSQIIHHSDYNDVHDFIDEVLHSFAENAKAEHSLVFKHHPLDRGHRDYRKYIKQLAKKLGVADRVYYGVDMHLPTMIKHSLGMVVVNSTTGLQSIYHKKPTKVMGRAIYNVKKLADQQPLSNFWQNPQKPNHDFYLRFREYLIENTQLNGSFYGQSPWKNEYLEEINPPVIDIKNQAVVK